MFQCDSSGEHTMFTLLHVIILRYQFKLNIFAVARVCLFMLTLMAVLGD